MSNRKKSFLVIAHGSRKEEANQQVLTLVKRLSAYFQTDMFEAAFMELASPSIKEGIHTLAKKGDRGINCFPLLSLYRDALLQRMSRILSKRPLRR